MAKISALHVDPHVSVISPTPRLPGVVLLLVSWCASQATKHWSHTSLRLLVWMDRVHGLERWILAALPLSFNTPRCLSLISELTVISKSHPQTWLTHADPSSSFLLLGGLVRRIIQPGVCGQAGWVPSVVGDTGPGHLGVTRATAPWFRLICLQ